MPKTGGKKLHYMLKNDFKRHQIKIGRDKLFDYLRDEYLLIPKIRRYYKTTNSRHYWMHKYSYLIKEIDINRPEQFWVPIQTGACSIVVKNIHNIYLKKNSYKHDTKL